MKIMTECPVCYEKLLLVAGGQCIHTVCETCLDKIKEHNGLCPLCRVVWHKPAGHVLEYENITPLHRILFPSDNATWRRVTVIPFIPQHSIFNGIVSLHASNLTPS